MSFPQPPQDPQSPQDPFQTGSEPAFRAPAGPPSMAAGIGDATLIDHESLHDHSELRSSMTVEKKPSIIGRLGLIGAAVVIAGGGAYAATTALSEPGGPSTPNEAVEQFFESLDNDDLLGMTEAMLPSERESLVEPGLDMLAELQRLELVDPDMDPAATSDFDFRVENLEISTLQIGTGVARTRVFGGTVSVSGNRADLPVGPLVTDRMEGGIPDEPFEEEMVDFADDQMTLAVVEEDGSWYVSLWYSVAEAARAEAEEPVPDFGNGVVPVGAADAEAAVETMINEMLDLDVEGSIAMLDPEEFRALYDYAPLFLDEAEAAVDELREEIARAEASWSLDRLDLSSEQRGDRTVVKLDGFAFSAEAEGESFTASFADDCFVFSQGEMKEEFCTTDLEEEFDTAGLPDSLSSLYFEGNGVTVVERDGRWFVSGMPTVIHGYNDLLAQLTRDDIDGLIDGVVEVFEQSFGLFGELGGFDESSFGESAFTEIDESINGELPIPEPIVVADEDRALMLPGLELNANDPTWYFGFETDLVPLGYTSGFDDDFVSVDVARFAPGSHDTLVAGLEADTFYEPVTIDGLPEGAVAYGFAEVDVIVVYGDLVVSSWIQDGDELLVRQVQHVAGS